MPLRSFEIDVSGDVPPEHIAGDDPPEHAPGDEPPEHVPGDDPPEQNNNQIHPVQPKAFVCENCGKSYSKAHKLNPITHGGFDQR